MPLEERQRLLRAYRAAVQAYHEAAASFDESRFQDSLHHTELARNRTETARAALLRHEHMHVDSLTPKPKDDANRIVIIGSTVSLFNLNSGHWDLFELAISGQPPADALAYAPSHGSEPGDWITDAREMDRRQNEKLFFTEAGLAILRDNGLEM